ncbi:MAG: hypothetical protein KIS92_12580 [Planctomycetota bacterium]|nr:hypothetical protein [Planctomycetota bacterium]
MPVGNLNRFRLRISLWFALILQVLQGLHGSIWWAIFSGLGVWSLAVPVTTTYGGVAMVLDDDRRGYRYTSEWARIFTATFASFFLTLTAIGLATLGVLILGCFGIIM